MLQRRMLSKEDEASSNDVEVRREDQEKINRFSKLHQRETKVEEQLKTKNAPSHLSKKDKEDLEELSTELILAGEDELIPYKIGDSFISLPLSEVQDLLATSTTQVEEEVSKLEERAGEIREEMQQLKVSLYARFGKGINLEA